MLFRSDYEGAKELTLRLLDECEDTRPPSTKPRPGKTEATRHRLARLEKKIAKKNDNHLFA